MIKYAMTNNTTGLVELVQAVNGDIEVPDGMTAIEIPYSSNDVAILEEYHAEGGVLVHHGAKPSESHRWNNGAWELDTEMESLKRSRAKFATRVESINSGTIAFGGNDFQCDGLSASLIAGRLQRVLAKQALGLPQEDVIWHDANNNPVTLTHQEFLQFAIAWDERMEAIVLNTM